MRHTLLGLISVGSIFGSSLVLPLAVASPAESTPFDAPAPADDAVSDSIHEPAHVQSDTVKAFRMTNGKFETKPFSQSVFKPGMPLDGMAISGDGSNSYSGILWLTSTNVPDQNGPGTLHAVSASNLSQELWNSGMNAARDGLGTLAKFAAPTVANGKVYVPTFSNSLMVYGLISQKAIIGQVVNLASGLSGSIAPGELVGVYGAGMGPAQTVPAQIASPGRISKSLAGTQVLFNNIASPLVYARADQIAAVVPNAVAGQSSVSVQVVYKSQKTTIFRVPVAATAPGLFTLDQSGKGAGAVLNRDMTINTPENPVPRGSVVVLFGTGQGKSDPDWAEDVLGAKPFPLPVSQVTVTIGGQPADVLYAGAAPGMAGIFSINVRVPSGQGAPSRSACTTSMPGSAAASVATAAVSRSTAITA